MGEPQLEFLTAGFCRAQPWLLWTFQDRNSRWKVSICVSLCFPGKTNNHLQVKTSLPNLFGKPVQGAGQHAARRYVVLWEQDTQKGSLMTFMNYKQNCPKVQLEETLMLSDQPWQIWIS